MGGIKVWGLVAKSEIPFTCLFTDQTLEREIKVLKRHGGMVGLSQDEETLTAFLSGHRILPVW